VFMNLCVNARDAMSQGGKLTVAAENLVLDEVYAGMNPDSKSGAYVVVRVEDTGMGIPREIQERIFEPFFTTKEIGKGTGLGLSTTLGILRSHGGFINLYSEPGKGAKFKVYLPAGAAPESGERPAAEPARLPRGQGELVLVVDDEEGIRGATQKTLERFGYRVLLAAHGAEAVALYAERGAEIAAVLTDMAMPVMDGPATILALKAMNPAVKIIGSSGHASQGGVAKAVGAGVQHFVPKPYTAETLLKVLADVLAQPA
jgi:CheY-like chemotaxis protein